MQTTTETRTALVVVDDDYDCHVLCGLVRQLPGFQAVDVSGGTGVGIMAALQAKLEPHLILLGTRLHDCETASLLLQVRKAWPHAEVVLVESPRGAGVIYSGLHLRQPFTLAGLREVMGV